MAATLENIAELLKNDIKVKVAGVDADGILRGKIMAKEKFLSSVKSGFGFSSAVFGWDMHDALFTNGVGMSSEGGGYADFIAVPDLTSFRRIPWENNIPFFLLHFLSENKPVVACPRGMTKSIVKKLSQENFKAWAGVELEFVNFQTPTEDGLLTKSIGIGHGVTPCFMAKPLHGMPGNSGHIHVSLTDEAGKNLFAREERNPSARWPDLEHLSDIGYHFLAGVLDALPDIMPMLAPTINSYKRFVENFWAPVAITWGNEDRLSSIRLITPPVCKPSAVRLEIRIPGADLHPHYALSAIFGAGLRGIQKKLDITVPPSSARTAEDGKPTLLANTLEKAVERFSAPTSVAREIFEEGFVDFYAATRQHELRLWREAVTDWEFNRYIETV
ncbi:hypothetical protein G7Z17_g4311 [Cylindrodendrum hubeiense]|uniref:Glutamine synthetase n=1 Tax=Cylindrodendrum hubeiense TaxID=595255 RepID=A0A9P5LCS3_9HYPO|nr:hypothetical protein G7Z17_g4311 [Cylindrodendrum hubeiense]